MPHLVSVPDPKPTPVRIAFSIPRVILEAIYAPDEVWDETMSHLNHLYSAVGQNLVLWVQGKSTVITLAYTTDSSKSAKKWPT